MKKVYCLKCFCLFLFACHYVSKNSARYMETGFKNGLLSNVADPYWVSNVASGLKDLLQSTMLLCKNLCVHWC